MVHQKILFTVLNTSRIFDYEVFSERCCCVPDSWTMATSDKARNNSSGAKFHHLKLGRDVFSQQYLNHSDCSQSTDKYTWLMKNVYKSTFFYYITKLTHWCSEYKVTVTNKYMVYLYIQSKNSFYQAWWFNPLSTMTTHCSQGSSHHTHGSCHTQGVMSSYSGC